MYFTFGYMKTILKSETLDLLLLLFNDNREAPPTLCENRKP